MDISLIVSILSLLVATLAESRNIAKDKRFSKVRPVGIGLLQLIFILDKIIDVGDQLLKLLAGIPLAENVVRIAILGKKWEILKLVEQQQQNLQDFVETCEAPLAQINSPVSVNLGDVINFKIPDKVIDVPGGKTMELQVVTWKLLEGETPFSKFSIAARTALHNLSKSTQVDKDVNALTLTFPQKITLKQEHVWSGSSPVIESQEFVEYDLTKTSDLRRLLETSKAQLNDLKSLRKRLADLTLESFSISELVGKE